MTKLDRNLSEVFGVPPLAAVEVKIPTLVPEEKEYPVTAPVTTDVTVASDTAAQIDDDTEFVKHKLRSILANGEMAFEALADIAKAEERASHFEALNGMMGQLSAIAMGILDAEGKRQKLKAGLGETPPQAGTVNNTQNNTTVFVGTTADLQKILDAEDDVIDITPNED